MRIAILSDIHANLAALEAVLEDIQHQQIDQVIVAGDIVIGAPDSLACWQRVQALGCPVIRGNHERYLYQFADPNAPAYLRSEQFAPVRWGYEEFAAADLEKVRRLPFSLRPHASLLIVHATQRTDRENVLDTTTDQQLSEMFPDPQANCIVRGHDHIFAVRRWNGIQLITLGSVGLPMDGKQEAQYLILEQHHGEWQPTHRSLPYAVGQTICRFAESGYLQKTGIMGQLFLRELQTAQMQLVPFLQRFGPALDAGELTLQQAFERFQG